jgi:hypothetical protein
MQSCRHTALCATLRVETLSNKRYRLHAAPVHAAREHAREHARRMPGRAHAGHRACQAAPVHEANSAMPAAQQQHSASRRCPPKVQDPPVARSTAPSTSFGHSRNGNCTLGTGAQAMFHRAVMGRHFSTAYLPARTAELDRATTRPLLCLAPVQKWLSSSEKRRGCCIVSLPAGKAFHRESREMKAIFTRVRGNR